MEIIERIQKIMEREGLNVASFARRIGVVDQTIRGIVVQRRNKPGFDLIVRILQTFDWVNAEWLILGVGEMSKPEQENLNNSERYSIKDLVMYLKEKDVKIEKLIEEKTEFKVLYEMAKKELESGSL
ncbi:MAG: helix-turn-helix transcriptional regulator [Bacteroidaceae bacterium]|nr:helix-turn-helix transcriptional regulator [Bacteroidaceae bacterium]